MTRSLVRSSLSSGISSGAESHPPTPDDARPNGESAGPSPEAPIVIVTAGDDGFAMPMAVTLSSALTHLPPEQAVQIIALDSGMSADHQRRISSVVRRAHDRATLDWHHPDVSSIDQIDLQDMDPRFNVSTFYRFLIPDVLPKTCTRVLYLDSDVVVERNLQPMWRTPFDGNAILAVPERIVSCPEAGVAEWERLGLDPDARYFNAGIMLINLAAWRADNIHGRAIKYLLDPSNRFSYPGDQEALNAVLAGRWGALDLRWNVTHLLYDEGEKPKMEAMLGGNLDPVAQDPFLIHYTSDRKPWEPYCDHPMEDRFHHYLRRSGWFSSLGYSSWRVGLAGRRGLHHLKTITRPIRHRIGLRRR